MRVAEEQREEVEEEERRNAQTQLARECGMSFLWVVYTEITALTFHTHTMNLPNTHTCTHTHTPRIYQTHTCTHTHTHTQTHNTHTHYTHILHTHTTHTHTTHTTPHTTPHTHSGRSTTNCVCGSHFLLYVHGRICPLPVPPYQLPR